MSDLEIVHLRNILKSGHKVLYTYDFLTWRKIVFIKDSNELGPMAYVENLDLDLWAVLKYCEAQQFCIQQDIFRGLPS